MLDLVQRYVALHPHEQANMSVVLFNCDSARLPANVAFAYDELVVECLPISDCQFPIEKANRQL